MQREMREATPAAQSSLAAEPDSVSPRLTLNERRGATDSGIAAMAHLADKIHFDRETLDRVNAGILLVLIGSGLAACVIGASIYDIGRMIALW